MRPASLFKALLLPLQLLAASLSAAEPVRIMPGDARLQVLGRADLSDPSQALLDWPMSGLRFRTAASQATLLLRDRANDWDVLVDGKPSAVLVTQAGQERYSLKLPGKPCVVELLKRTEGSFGAAAFLGLELAEDADLLPLPPAPSRRVLVLGDSWAAGYGAESSTITCATLRPWENARLAFPCLASAAFGAEARVLAVSGRGLMRHYGSAAATDPDNYTAFYRRRLSSKAEPEWVEDGWQPDAIVIHLGLNDFSTDPAPEGEAWAKAYAGFMQELHQSHPQARLFICLTQGWPNRMKEMFMAQAEAAKLGISADVVGLPAIAESQMGCDMHPNAQAHQALAKPLIEAMSRDLGWEPR
jgi:lysophospholipase L1-like esterase